MIGKRYGRLTVISKTDKRNHGKIVWTCQCDCGNLIDVPTHYLNNGDTQSCGCLKRHIDPINLRDKYDNKRVNGVAIHLFKDKAPRKDSSTGYRGVSRYYTRVSNQERYRAWITVNGKRYYKSGFLTAEGAYYKGRLYLEDKYLPTERTDKDD